MSGFRTKLDFSDNRQAKQRPITRTVLSGGTSFGVPFDLLPTGPNLTASAITNTQTYIASTFSGDNTSTVYSWADPRMQLGITALSALTSSTSGLTQQTGAIWTANTTTVIDGNTVALTYSGVNFDISVVTIAQLTPTTYSGTITTNTFETYSATSLDYTGRTIWVDVSGITRTEKLIISDNPQVGYVWTCLDSEGMGGWVFNSSATTATIWTAGTGANSAVLAGSGGIASGITSVSEGTNTIAGGDYSHAEGQDTNALGDYGSHAEGYQTISSGWSSHAEGNQTIASGDNAHAEGESTMASGIRSHAEGYFSQATGQGSHAEGGAFVFSSLYSGGTASGDASHAEGVLTIASGVGSHAEGWSSIASGTTSHAEGYFTIAGGYASHAEGSNTSSFGARSHAEGQSTIAQGDDSHAEGYITTANGIASHAEGAYTTANGAQAHAEGNNTLASGDASHAEGYNCVASGNRSHAGGSDSISSGLHSFVHGENSQATGINTVVFGKNITGTSNNTVYINNLYATNANSNFYTNFNTSNENSVIMNGGNNTLTYIESNINSSNSIRVGVRGSSVALWDEYGKNNDSFLYSSIDNNGLNIISAPGTGTEDYIRFYAGQNAESIYTPDLHIQGTGSTRGYIGINNDNPLQLLHLKSSNEAKILIQADTDNINENDNAELLLTQDGGGSTANFSITPDTSNNLLIGVNSATVPDILFATRSDSTVFTTSADTKMILKNYGDLILKNTTSDSKFGINTMVPQYTIDAYGDTDSRLFYNGTAANGGAFNLSATTGLPLFGVIAGTANTANQTASISLGVRAWDDPTYTVYGYQGDAFIYAGIYTNGLNIISNDGSTLGTGADYIRFYAGQSTGAGATNNPDLHIQGSGSSRGFVAINIPYNQDPTQRLDVNGNARFRSIGSSASAGALHYTSDGTLTTNTSDERLKTNINTLTNALEKVKQLRGVNYNWKEEENGDVRIGFIAQEVNKIVPELTFINKNSDEQYMGVHYDNVTALLVEAIKELSTGSSIVNNTYLETQTVLAEDNNIELNFNGNHITAVGGGLRVLHAKGQDNASELVTDNEGNFVTNNDFKPNALTIPFYTPSSTNDVNGNEGNITRDDNFLYVKTSTGWKRTNLENF
jgi:hypothetical protein